jgi:D-xylose transport system permease protein
MTEATLPQGGSTESAPRRSIAASLRAAGVDMRLLGMFLVLGVIWIGFHIISNGGFITPRNLWNLSVQSSSIGIMATGMVLIIVARNIDLSVGAILGFVGYSMAMMQTIWIPLSLGFGLEQPWAWVVTVAFGILLGALLGLIQGFIVAYLGVPSFIVTLGGLLVWRGLIFQYVQGQTLAPLDSTFRLLGGGPLGSVGEQLSWVIGALVCVAIVYALITNRRRRKRYGFAMRPIVAEVAIGIVACGAVLLAVATANSYYWPENLANDFAEANGIPIPEGGLLIPTGIANPVLILLGVGGVMTYIATRRRFGRNVYAIGGNPDAALLSGINVKRTVMYTFGLMGLL